MKIRHLVPGAVLLLSLLPRLDALVADSPAPPAPPLPPARTAHGHHHHGGSDEVVLFSSNHVTAGQALAGDVVAIAGNNVIDGSVGGDVVAVMGNDEINGSVGGDVVAVMGDLTLGPKARVGGDVVCVGGALTRDPEAVVGGEVQNPSIGAHINLGPLRQVCTNGFRSGWVWLANLAVLGLYALVALAFPNGIRRCGAMLAERPGITLLSFVLTILALPLVFALLVVTLIGIPVAIFLLPAGFVLLWMFGKASFYALIGRALSKDRLPPWAAVGVGGFVCLLFFLIPVAGILLSLAISAVMVGAVVAVLLESVRRQPAGRTPSAPVPPAGAAAAPVPATASGTATAPAPAATEPPSPLEAGTPPLISVPVEAPEAAGFWIRTAAVLLDLILVGVVSAPFAHRGDHSFILPLVAIYGAILWKLRGSTVGGIVCGLKVVRLDGRPLDWPTVIVRAMGCFLSLIVLGLGFLWVASIPAASPGTTRLPGRSWSGPPAGTPWFESGLMTRPAKA